MLQAWGSLLAVLILKAIHLTLKYIKHYKEQDTDLVCAVVSLE